jgi:alkylhydroperoxidase/carboxymuconolactone decarboxylase family protein YurZ
VAEEALADIGNGVTKTELRELLLHLSTYGGFPKAASAFKIASDVFKEPEAKKRGRKRDDHENTMPAPAS